MLELIIAHNLNTEKYKNLVTALKNSINVPEWKHIVK